jgi:uncharacterized protein
VSSATELSTHSECQHRLSLDFAAKAGTIARPGQSELKNELLERRGREHEARVLDALRAQGRSVVTIDAAGPLTAPVRARAAEQTLAAMGQGADVIYQGVLEGKTWLGRPDFLVRAAGASRFGDFHYEAADAKLARITKARAVLQLCVYTELLEEQQGAEPRRFWIAPGGEAGELVELKSAEYMAYYRQARGRFVTFAAEPSASLTYPEPVEHCGVCPWWKTCEDRRRTDDHLSLVAGATRRHREWLADAEVHTAAALGALDPARGIAGIKADSLARVREQARIQLRGRQAQRALYELLPKAEEAAGLELLPEPSKGDLFLDLEGDSFYQGQGIEYLFGLLELGVEDDYFGKSEKTPDRYHAYWAANRGEERRAFEALVDKIRRRRDEFPDAHVFHFGHRESTALKNLSSRFGTRGEVIDEFLRGGVLVDLHRIVRQSIRASVESYSLKQLEPLYRFQRRVPVRDASAAMQLFGWWLETGERIETETGLRATIATYNEDDCRSTLGLRDWLEKLRPEAAAQWRVAVGRPEQKKAEASPKVSEQNEKTAALIARLTSGLPDNPDADDEEQSARRLFSHLLGWHQRELKPGYWEFYRTINLAPEDRVEDRAVLGDLVWVSSELLPKPARSYVHRYGFPAQEHSLKVGDTAVDPSTEDDAGTIVEVGDDYIVLKRGKDSETPHPRALVPDWPLQTKAQQDSLHRMGEWIADHGALVHGRYQAGRDLLARRAPRAGQPAGTPLVATGEEAGPAITRLAKALEHSALAVQGPPGSGKTTAAAAMILELVRAGRRVGVTANSHKVILNLLRRVCAEAERHGLSIRIAHMGDEDDYDGEKPPFEVTKKDIAKRLSAGQLDVVGGTPWAWSRSDLVDTIDTLVVDEAGQLSLANVLCVSPSARKLVLFGDPAQLEQPQKGVHPEGSDASALEHLLGKAQVMPPDLGVFMSKTRRLHPDICRFTSRVFYDGQLESDPSLANQRVLDAGPLTGTGTRFIPVDHRGNTNYAPEEVERVAALIDDVFAGAPRFIDVTGTERPLTRQDVLVVAPYNVQVSALKRRLPSGFRVGTVDKFQGQEAPIVIYTMTASSAEDAPKGLEFLFSLNRLNVATSRAQAVVAIVASPGLAAARCKTPRHMKLANAFCVYVETANDWIE